MKFSEYLIEAEEINLIGKKIGGHIITPDVQNKTWNGAFECSAMGLSSLRGAPYDIDGPFYCENNNLKSLEYAPKLVVSDFFCSSNLLTDLKGAPALIGGDFSCMKNPLTSLEGAPKEINGYFDCEETQLTNLKGIHKIITRIDACFYCKDSPITSHVLGLLLITGLKNIVSNSQWGIILNKYLGRGRNGLIDAQNELIEEGFEEYAQL